MSMEHSTITSKGQTTIPMSIRRRLGLKPGDRLVYDERDGEIILRPHPGVTAVAGMLRDDLKRQSTGEFDAERSVAHKQWGRDGSQGLKPGEK